MIEVKIANISITQVGFALLLKNDSDDRVVPIFIGPLETHSISSVLSGNKPPRPMTHDLMVDILNRLDVKILRVVIRELRDNTFFANILLKTSKGVLNIDARPSDSIALALRKDVPIYMEESVLNEAGILLPDEESEPETLEETTTLYSDPAEGGNEPPKETTEDPRQRRINDLKRQLELAVDLENYEEAARLRDELRNFESEN